MLAEVAAVDDSHGDCEPRMMDTSSLDVHIWNPEDLACQILSSLPTSSTTHVKMVENGLPLSKATLRSDLILGCLMDALSSPYARLMARAACSMR